MQIWENQVTIFSAVDKSFTTELPASCHEQNCPVLERWADLEYEDHLCKDVYSLPCTDDREGYYGSDHFSYWASGLRDSKLLLKEARSSGIKNPLTVLDIGCASGRLIRHLPFLLPDARILGCDINRLHVEFCNKYLHPSISAFHNCSVPHLQIEDSSVDVVTAYSVFTHIEAMETAWLMEIRRILRPGGLAWITIHTENTLKDLDEGWPMWNAVMNHPNAESLIDKNTRLFENDRLVLRWNADKSYSSNVFYKKDYVLSHWSRIMKILDIKRKLPEYQDVVLLIKH